MTIFCQYFNDNCFIKLALNSFRCYISTVVHLSEDILLITVAVFYPVCHWHNRVSQTVADWV